MADQNGRRDRGVQVVQSHSSQNAGGHQRGRNNDHRDRGRGHDNHGQSNRGGHNDHGWNDRGHHDNRGRHHGHSGGSISIHIGGTISHGNYGHVTYRTPAPRPSYAQLEYQRGYADAQCAGFEAGKLDALACRPFCDTVNVCFDRVSVHYRAGYLAAYACAYRDGFSAGERARRPMRPVYTHSVTYRYPSTCRW